MKFFISLIIALFAVSAHGYYGIDIDTVLATKQSGVLKNSQISFILQSQYNSYQTILHFYNLGDTNGNGYLSYQEFATAYGQFIYFVLGQNSNADFLGIRVTLGDINANGVIDLSEFTFLVLSDLRFIHNNYNLFNGNL